MDADDRAQPRVRECHEALFEEALTRKIIGAFFHVHNALGFGFLESVYRRALHRELRKRGLNAQCEVAVDVYYDDEVVGAFRADMIVESRVVLEIKASRKLDPTDISQVLNYLRATDLELGLLLHFGPRATVKRLIETKGLRSRNSQPRPSVPSATSAVALFRDTGALPQSRT